MHPHAAWGTGAVKHTPSKQPRRPSAISDAAVYYVLARVRGVRLVEPSEEQRHLPRRLIDHRRRVGVEASRDGRRHRSRPAPLVIIAACACATRPLPPRPAHWCRTR